MTRASDVANILKQPFTNTLGTSNYRAGTNAGDSITSGGNYNVTIGDEAGTAITTGDNNTAVGYLALSTATTASDNTAVGRRALRDNTSGYNNVSVGVNSSMVITEGNTNTAIGTSSLGANTSGSSNVAVGDSALLSNTTASNNTAVGKSSMSAMIDGATNTAVGRSALSDDTKGSKSTAVGYQALSTQNFTSSTDSHNTAVGYNAGSLVSTGVQGVYVGSLAGDADTTGGKNTYVGYNAGGANGGDQNVFIGHSAGSTLTDGDKNTFVGKYDGNSGGLDLRTSDNNIVLSDGDGNPRFRINSAGRQTFQSGATYGHINAIGEVGTSFVAIAFEHTTGGGVIGSISTASSSTSFNTASDYRMKENVKDMTGAIDRVKQLLPKRFNFKSDADTTIDGFLAHEAQSIIPEAVHGEKDAVDDNGNAVMQGIDQAKLVPLLTGALKEAIEKIESLEKNMAKNSDINDIQKRVTALEGS